MSFYPEYLGAMFVDKFVLMLFKYMDHYEITTNTQSTAQYNPTDFKIYVKNSNRMNDDLFENILSDIIEDQFDKNGDRIWTMFMNKNQITLDFNIENMLNAGGSGLCI